MNKQTATKTEFLQEWDKRETKYAEKQILNFCKSHHLHTHHTPDACPFYLCQNFNDVDKILGLAYTSSSFCAMLSPCNTELFFDKHNSLRVAYFAMSKQGLMYAAVWDENENEFFFNI